MRFIDNTRPASPLASAVLASSAFIVPLALSASSVPAPNHPRIFWWYKTLREPDFKPPDIAFPIAWTAIEACLAVAGYRLLRSAGEPRRNQALGWWGWNVLMIGGWSRLFFKRHQLGVSAAAAASLVATSAVFVNAAAPVDRTASRAGLPLLGWAAFATVLTATIWAMNPRKSE